LGRPTPAALEEGGDDGAGDKRERDLSDGGGQLAGEIRARNLSAVEVVDAVLERMGRLEPILHAFCTPTPEAAREDAPRASTPSWARAATPGRSRACRSESRTWWSPRAWAR
jgi:hypothetical protein